MQLGRQDTLLVLGFWPSSPASFTLETSHLHSSIMVDIWPYISWIYSSECFPSIWTVYTSCFVISACMYLHGRNVYNTNCGFFSTLCGKCVRWTHNGELCYSSHKLLNGFWWNLIFMPGSFFFFYILLLQCNRSWDCWVGMATGYGLDGYASIPSQSKRFFSSPQLLYQPWGLPSLFFSEYQKFFPRE